MTRLSERFSWPALALVLAAALPVWSSLLDPRRFDDCADPSLLREAKRIEGTVRSREFVDRYRPGQTQFTGGAVRNAGGTPLRFQIVRTYDPVPLYHSPSQYVSHHTTPEDPTELRWLDANGERLPVHWRTDTAIRVPVLIQYFYVFRGRPIRHPFPASLAALATQLRYGTLPVTLVLVHGVDEFSSIEAMREASDDWLVAAWKYYDEVCNP